MSSQCDREGHLLDGERFGNSDGSQVIDGLGSNAEGSERSQNFRLTSRAGDRAVGTVVSDPPRESPESSTRIEEDPFYTLAGSAAPRW
jgi:hypothetical protein